MFNYLCEEEQQRKKLEPPQSSRGCAMCKLKFYRRGVISYTYKTNFSATGLSPPRPIPDLP